MCAGKAAAPSWHNSSFAFVRISGKFRLKLSFRPQVLLRAVYELRLGLSVMQMSASHDDDDETNDRHHEVIRVALFARMAGV